MKFPIFDNFTAENPKVIGMIELKDESSEKLCAITIGLKTPPLLNLKIEMPIGNLHTGKIVAASIGFSPDLPSNPEFKSQWAKPPVKKGKKK